MKTKILTLLLCVVSVFCFGNEFPHLEFKGIPIDGPVDEFVNKLKDKGYKYVIDNGRYKRLEGKFMGEDAVIGVWYGPKSKTVDHVTVYFDVESLNWKLRKLRYNTILEAYAKKYGTIYELQRDFETPYSEGDGHEVMALKNNKVKYVTTWVLTTEGNVFNSKKLNFIGYIKLYMQYLFIAIDYIDIFNYDKYQTEVEQDI